MRWIYTATLVLLMANVGFTEEFPVHIEILDGPQGERVHARAYLRRDGVSLLPEGFQTYEKRDEKHFLVPGEFTLHLPEGSYELRLERGLEYHPLETRLDVRGALTRTLVLERWVDMNQAGSYSGDLHVHRSPNDMEAILRAEDLNFAPTITTHVWGDDIRRPWKTPDEFIVRVAPTKLYTANAQGSSAYKAAPVISSCSRPNFLFLSAAMSTIRLLRASLGWYTSKAGMSRPTNPFGSTRSSTWRWVRSISSS